MPALTKAPQEAIDMMEEILKEHHKDLDTHRVIVSLLMVHPDEKPDTNAEDIPPLKLNGYPCAAIVSVIPYKYRVLGCADALIQIDAKAWEIRDDEERKALLDHELYHLQVSKNVNGEPIQDKSGRPKLKMRLHDVQVGWFTEIAKRHGMASGEVQDASHIIGNFRQVFFPFLEGAETKPAIRALKKGGKE